MPYPTGDLNQDGIVDSIDLSILVSNWNTSDPTSDINNDGIVDSIDLSILVGNWGAESSDSTYPIVLVTANGDDGNVPTNTIDSDPDTRWSYNGEPSILTADLGQARLVGGVSVWQYAGANGNPAIFDIETSPDNVTWTKRLVGLSSGALDDLEEYPFPAVSARYVRYVGYGRQSSPWNSIVEFQVLASQGAVSPSVPNLTPTASDGEVLLLASEGPPSPVVDTWEFFGGDSEGSMVSLGAASSSTTLVDSGLTNDTQRYYMVRATNVDGTADSAVMSATPHEPPATTTWQAAWDTQDPETVESWFYANTGAGDTSTLTLHSGPLVTTADNQVIEDLFIDQQITGWGQTSALTIAHNNVTVRNVYILRRRPVPPLGAANGRWYGNAVTVQSGLSGVTTFENVTINGDRAEYGDGRDDANFNNVGIKAYSTINLQRTYITSCRQAVQCWGGANDSVIEETFMEDAWRNTSGVSTNLSSWRMNDTMDLSVNRRNMYRAAGQALLSFSNYGSNSARNCELIDCFFWGIPAEDPKMYNAAVGPRCGSNTAGATADLSDIRVEGNRFHGSFTWFPIGWHDPDRPGSTMIDNRWMVSQELITDGNKNG